MKQLVLTGGLFLMLASSALAASIGGGGGSLPSGGTVNDCILNTAPGVGTWQACPGAAGGDNVSVNGAATVNPDLATTGSDLTLTNTANVITFTLKSGLTVTNWTMVNPALGTPASGVATNLTGTATGLTVGTANAGDSATSFFPSGTLEDARLPTSMADKAVTGSLNIPNGAAPTTDAFGEIAGDNNAWAASRGAVQWFDGTANTYLLGTLASDVPANGECPKWNTGGTITWETCAAGGSVATDTIWDAAGDLVYGTGSNTSVRLAPGTANQLLRMNAGVTAPEWTSTLLGLTSIDFGSNPADTGRLRLSNNESICWELNSPGTDKCLFLNASDEFELNAPLNLTGTAGPLLLTGIASPSAPGTVEQWYFYATSVDDRPKYIYNGGSEQTFYTTAYPQTTVTGNAGTATAFASNPTDCSANQFANAIAASGDLTCAALTDAAIPDTITASNYLPLIGGELTGSLVTDNLGIEFTESDTNPGCAASEYKIYADLSENKLKKCMNGSATDMDTTGGTPSFDTITGGTNTTAAMIVGTGGSLAVSGSGTIAATTSAALAANGGNCSAGSYPLGVGADGAVESCTAYASETKTLTNTTLNCSSGTGNVCTIWERRGGDLVGLAAAATVGHVWDFDPLSTTCTATAITGTNQSYGVCTFPDSDGEYGRQLGFDVPTGGIVSMNADILWKTTGTGNARLRIQTICYASDVAADSAYSNSTYVTAAAGTSGRIVSVNMPSIVITGCDAGERMALRFSRNRTEGSDTLNAALDVRRVTLNIEVAQ